MFERRSLRCRCFATHLCRPSLHPYLCIRYRHIRVTVDYDPPPNVHHPFYTLWTFVFSALLRAQGSETTASAASVIAILAEVNPFSIILSQHSQRHNLGEAIVSRLIEFLRAGVLRGGTFLFAEGYYGDASTREGITFGGRSRRLGGIGSAPSRGRTDATGEAFAFMEVD